MARSSELRVVITGDPRGLHKAFGQASAAAGKFETRLGQTSDHAKRAFGALARSGTLAAGLGFGAMLRAGVDFEKQMARVRAVSGATGKQFAGLTDLAKELGAKTKYSAGQAAEGMYELASAGFKVEEIHKALPGTLSLAAASSIDLKDAAEISANALRGFGLQASQSGHVADILAMAVNTSSVEMRDLQYSLKYVSPVARATGQSMEDMVAALDAMGDAGIKGETAGTTLRGALVRLVKPTDDVVSGFDMLGVKANAFYGPKGLKPLPQIIKILEERTKGMSVAQRNQALALIFGTNAVSGMSAVIQKGSKAVAANSKELKNSQGAAKRAADIMNDTVAGAWENFTGSVETASISLYEKFAPALKDALRGAAEGVNSVAKLPGKLAKTFSQLRDEKGGVGRAFATLIADGLDKVPWGEIGHRISAGLRGALKFGDALTENIAAGIGAAVSRVNGRQVLGKLVDVIGEAIDALFSPSFWQEHWKGVLSAVTLVIPVGKLLKIPGFNTLFRFISRPVFRAVGEMGKGLLSLFGKAGGEGVIRFLVEIEKVAPRLGRFLLGLVTLSTRRLSGLPGRLKGVASDAANAVAKALGDATGLIVGKVTGWAVRGVAALGRRVKDFLTSGSKAGRAVATGIIAGLGSLGHQILDKVKDAVGWVADQVGNLGSSIGKKLGIGDGLGKAIGDGLGGIGAGGVLPSGGAFGGSLMGARAAMRPFAAIGSRFGLQVSSGRRPGAITSSGNTSWHSTGEAIDESGSPGGMLAYFRYLKSHFGGRLSELIHTPGGVGIKDGRPFRYTGQVAADHFDHVHVAFDSGRRGLGDGLGKRIGDGLGRFIATSYGPPWGGIQGSGVTATGVNLRDGRRYHGIAVDPRVIPLHKRVKVWPNPFNWRGTFETFDTGGDIKGHRIDFYDWRGRRAQNAWGSRNVTISTGGSTVGGRDSGGNRSSGGRVPLARLRPTSGRGVSVGHGRAEGTGNIGPQGLGTGRRTDEQARENRRQAGLAGPGDFLGYPGTLAQIGVEQAQAKSSGSVKKMLTALYEEAFAKRQRLKRVNSLLKRRIKRATRQSLNEEKVQLLADLQSIGETFKAYSENGMGPDGSPGDPADKPTPMDFANAAVAEASLTPDLNDDVTAAAGVLGIATSDLAAARASGDPRKITEAIAAWTAANDAWKAATEAVTLGTETQQRLTEAIVALTAETKTQNDFAATVAGVATTQAVRALADVISGQIVGTNLQGRRQTAGTGALVRIP